MPSTAANTIPQRYTDTLWIVVAVGALIAIRLIAAALIDLGADESYYFLWSRHLAWSYYDHPPMVAWWIALGTATFGDHPFGIRVVFVLSAIPTSIAVYLTGRVLFDRAAGGLAALWINATLLFGVGGLSATPDAPAVMFWALAACAFAYLTKTGRGEWWLAVGLFAGFGVASKLTDLFLGLGILLCLVVYTDLRRWWTSFWLWLGALAAALVVAPMILWNLDHDWATFARQFSRLTPRAFDPLRFPEFIATQFALLNPLIAMFVGLATAVWIGGRPAYPIRAIGLLLWTTVPPIAYMALHSLHGQVQAHWLAPIFPTLVVAAAGAATAPPAIRYAALRSLAFPVGVGLSLVGLILAANPYGILPPRLDPGQVNHGWEGVAADAERLREQSGAGWIAAANYAAHAIVAYNLRDTGVPVIAVTGRARYAFAPPPDPALLDRPALLIVNEAGAGRFASCFAEMTPVGTIERRSGEAIVETFAAFRVASAKPTLLADGC